MQGPLQKNSLQGSCCQWNMCCLLAGFQGPLQHSILQDMLFTLVVPKRFGDDVLRCTTWSGLCICIVSMIPSFACCIAVEHDEHTWCHISSPQVDTIRVSYVDKIVFCDDEHYCEWCVLSLPRHDCQEAFPNQSRGKTCEQVGGYYLLAH